MDVKDYQIINLTTKHIPLIVALENKYFPKSPWPENHWDYEINQNPVGIVKGLFIDDQLVGYIDYWITFDSSTVAKICVDEKYRHKGIATNLLTDMFKNLKENDVLYSTLEVRVSNVAAINLYKKFGFDIITTKPAYYADGEDAYYMVKGVL